MKITFDKRFVKPHILEIPLWLHYMTYIFEQDVSWKFVFKKLQVLCRTLLFISDKLLLE